jgi:hypothetical protein
MVLGLGIDASANEKSVEQRRNDSLEHLGLLTVGVTAKNYTFNT